MAGIQVIRSTVIWLAVAMSSNCHGTCSVFRPVSSSCFAVRICSNNLSRSGVSCCYFCNLTPNVYLQLWLRTGGRAKTKPFRGQCETGSGTRWNPDPLAWESRRLVVWRYRLLFLAYALVGPRSWFRALARHRFPLMAAVPLWVQGWAARHQFPLPGWVDSHALLTDPHRGSGAARVSGYEVGGQMARSWQ